MQYPRVTRILGILAAIVTLQVLLNGAAARAETQVLKAAGYVDVRAGIIARPAVIVIEDERIVAVNPATMPDSGTVIDLGDRILLPGLMDMHTHLAFDDTSPGWTTISSRWTPAEFALFGVDAARRVLMAGFTTVRDISSWRGFPDVALARAIDRGWIIGPEMFPAGHALSITGGHCDLTGYAPGVLEGKPEYGIADGVDEVLKAVRYQIKHGVRTIKICATAGVGSFESRADTQQYTVEEMRAAVQEAHRHGLIVGAHAIGAVGVRASVEAGVDSIEHGFGMTEETALLMKQRGIILVPTMYLQDAPKSRPPEFAAKAALSSNLAEAGFQTALRAGVRMAVGSDLDAAGAGPNAGEFYALVRRGMPRAEAIRAGTVNGAELLGLDDRGEIKAGLRADLIAVQGNPLADIRVLEHVDFVMKGGVIHKHIK